jgi:hypothetical protein
MIPEQALVTIIGRGMDLSKVREPAWKIQCSPKVPQAHCRRSDNIAWMVAEGVRQDFQSL